MGLWDLLGFDSGTDDDTAAASVGATGAAPDGRERAAGEKDTGSTAVRVTYDSEPTDDGALIDDDSRHQHVVGPSSIERRPNGIRAGTDWTRTFWIAEFPDLPVDGLFENLYATGETRRTDISIHLDPRDTQATLDALENRIEDLEADFEYLADKRRAGARGVKKDLNDYRDLYDVLRNTSMKAFDVSMYLTARGETSAETDATGVRNAARQSPANLTPVTPRWAQLDALVSASPIATDRLAATVDSRTPMLAGAVSAMFPFVAGTVAEDGIEYGTYALNESPIILDRFQRETGYCTMVIGQLGAGKSFASKLQLVRRAMFDEETMIVMLDPLAGFAGLNDALDGERITVGGTRGLNPLELRPTPPDVLDDAPDLDPWATQVGWVLAFFETFFASVADNPLGERTQTLRRAVQEAYARNGITRDPATHDNPSPTVRDVIAVLEDMLGEPGSFGYETDAEREQVADQAQSLLTDLRPSFRADGDLANLATRTELDLDSKVLYLDLHQNEGARGRTETSLMMQVLFNAVYERAKGTDKRVVFVIDEAHYLLNDAASLEFLETAVRHSRHYDLSIQFVTQTGGEFTLTSEAKTIANLCSMTQIHRVQESADELAEWFGLNEREVDWVRSAKAGNDRDGYAEALLCVDEEGHFPVQIRASDVEAEVIDGTELASER
jgi:hypothetical protein